MVPQGLRLRERIQTVDREGRMNQSRVKEIIRQDVGWHWLWLMNPNVYLSDIETIATTYEIINEADHGFIPSREYTRERHDCENQHRERLGYLTAHGVQGIGTGWNDLHVFGLFLTEFNLWVFDGFVTTKYRDALSIYHNGRQLYKLSGSLSSRPLIAI